MCQNGRRFAFGAEFVVILKQAHRAFNIRNIETNYYNEKKKQIIIMKKEVSTKKLVETIVEGIQNRKGQRIVTVDLRKLPIAPAEYFIIAEGGSNTQVAAIADEVDSFVRTQTHVHPLFVDGRDNAEWIVLDYGNIFVHIMQREPRAYYDIEHLWADGKITEIPEA